MYICIYIYIHIHNIHKWSYVIYDTQSAQIWQKQDVHNIYMQSWKQCGLPIITIIALRQLMSLGTWCTVHLWPLIYTVHHVPKCLSCHKAIVVIRAYCVHDCIYIYIYIYIYIKKCSLVNLLMFVTWYQRYFSYSGNIIFIIFIALFTLCRVTIYKISKISI